jgi:hypothetical protein
MDSIPPKVLADGLGNRAAGRVPELMFVAFVVSVEHDAAAFERSPQAGWDWWGAPVVEMLSIQLCEAAAMDSIPPKVLAEGFGN